MSRRLKIGREPSESVALKAGELIFPHTDLWTSGELAGGEQVNNVSRANLGRAKVEGEVATVGEVMVSVAPSDG